MTQQRRRSDEAENIKGKWVVLYGIELSTPYGINEGMVSTYGFFSPTNHEGKTIWLMRNGFLTEQGKSFQSPRFVFNVNYNGKIGQMLYQYKQLSPYVSVRTTYKANVIGFKN